VTECHQTILQTGLIIGTWISGWHVIWSGYARLRKYSTQVAYNLWIRSGTTASIRATRVGGCASHNNVIPNAGCHMQLVSIWDHLPCGQIVPYGCNAAFHFKTKFHPRTPPPTHPLRYIWCIFYTDTAGITKTLIWRESFNSITAHRLPSFIHKFLDMFAEKLIWEQLPEQ